MAATAAVLAVCLLQHTGVPGLRTPLLRRVLPRHIVAPLAHGTRARGQSLLDDNTRPCLRTQCAVEARQECARSGRHRDRHVSRTTPGAFCLTPVPTLLHVCVCTQVNELLAPIRTGPGATRTPPNTRRDMFARLAELLRYESVLGNSAAAPATRSVTAGAERESTF
jgi:hypothetical protein